MRRSHWLLLIVIIGGCAAVGTNLESLYGSPEPRDRVVQSLPTGAVDYWDDVKPIIDQRCIVCHGCYDAPCQLKMTAIEGIERGASNERVYNQSRIHEADPTRLFVDAQSVSQWRDMGFHPVLNEFTQTPEANRDASVLYRMLQLKRENPLPVDKRLTDDFDLGISRDEVCTTADDFDDYAKDHPGWGMPYALPGLNEQEERTLMSWVEQGSIYTPRPPLPMDLQQEVARWEKFFNEDSLKQQLASRYIFEHLSYAHLYFSEFGDARPRFFSMVRSKTPPGQPLSIIASRRPYDDPGVERFYYRLRPVVGTLVEKTHMPYALNTDRMKRWQELFLEADYELGELPSYEPQYASNPFVTFGAIPVTSRYKFLLDEAKFSIETFIKGPVCRGEVAVDVIQDRFWVFFTNPDNPADRVVEDFLQTQAQNLQLPASTETIYRPMHYWSIYKEQQTEFLAAKDQFLADNFKGSAELNLNTIWDGGGSNPNAALTVFRHFDSATVEQGLIGEPTRTAWVIDYSLLERIHYLLVAGYDVFGNLGHQLNTRVYMDFLRMEGEGNFLVMLPEEARKKEMANWYQGANDSLYSYLSSPAFESSTEPAIDYKTDKPKVELYEMLGQRLSKALPHSREMTAIGDQGLRQELLRLHSVRGTPATLLPEVANVQILADSGTGEEYITLLADSAYTNMTAVFGAKHNRRPDMDRITVVPGFIGAYPNAFYRVKRGEIKGFVDAVMALEKEGDYSELLDQWGVRRTNQDFWEHSDQIHAGYRERNPVTYGALDYNRLENR